MRILTMADGPALALLCDAYAEYLEAREKTSGRKGKTYETTTAQGGTMIRPRPEVAMASDAWRRVQRMLSEFGLTPSSRAKVVVRPKEEEDPLEKLRNAGRAS